MAILPSPQSVPAITGYPSLDSVLRSGLIAGSAALATWIVSTLKLTDPNLTAWISAAVFGVLLGIATAAWGLFKARYGDAVAVMAGVNLALSDKVLMQGTGDGKIMPVPVTPASAQQIIKDYSKPIVQDETATTASLNKSQLKGAKK